ncbi:hypothetical protein LTR36_007318 [Oleoguttula mirabilis]|uniref:Uncharacterized protein n=1 Tax=Oleoguttula mirabilis TaxID=1507867 RepID=A0AAV9JAH9_9PEZI|nr:hypothetical protein LTR36_007318 [Oleoguttula mirabilis]
MLRPGSSFRPSLGERKGLGQSLKEYKWTLKVNSEAGAGFMKHALALIEQSSRIVLASSGDRSLTTSPAKVRESMASFGFTPWSAPATQQHRDNRQNNGDDLTDIDRNGQDVHDYQTFAGAEGAWDLEQQFGDYTNNLTQDGISAFSERYGTFVPP